MTEETTLQTEIKRLETALEALTDLNLKAEALQKENEKQRQAHQASLALIKKDYDAVLEMAEELLKSVQETPEDTAEAKEAARILAAAENDNANEHERVLIEL